MYEMLIMELKSSVNLRLFLLMSLLMPFYGLIPAQASSDLFFLDPKRGAARVLHALHLKSVKSQIVVSDLIEEWSESVGPPWSGFLHF